MNAKEFMIGDWVEMRLPNNSYIDFALLDSMDDVLLGRLIAEPIPLTEEILKKNGFAEESLGRVMSGYMNCDHRLHLAIEKNTDYGIIVIKDYVEIKRRNKDFNMLPIHVCLKVQWVHELQHALRLCGLNDLADNFKI